MGDRIVTRRNSAALGVDNGTRGTVTAIDKATRAMDVRSDDARSLTISSAYLDAGHVEHAYVQTAHLTQGSTAEAALIVTTPDEHAAEWTYTAASRTRGKTQHLVLALEPDRQLEAGDTRSIDPALAIAHLKEAMRHEQAERLAALHR